MILSREEKLKTLSKLPSDLQEMIFSDVTVGIIDKICKKYNLSEDKSATLVSLISDVLFGNMGLEQLHITLKQKLEIDEQTAASLNLDLTTELFSKVKTSLQKIRPSAPIAQPVIPQAPAAPARPAPIPTPLVGTLTPAERGVGADQYREPTAEGPARQQPEPQAMAGGPEIVDLRKTPPSPMQMPVAAAPAYIPEGISAGKPIPPMVNKVEPPRPLTFTKPVEPPVKIELPVVSKIEPIKPTPSTPLIEAEPHKVAPPLVTSPQPLAPEIKAPEMLRPPVVSQFEPQFIIRPPGLAPTDLPHDVLDLRKEKGEF